LMGMFFFASASVTFKGNQLIERAVMSSSKIVGGGISLLNFAARIFGVDVTFGLLGKVTYFLLLATVVICDVDLLAQFFY
jgi:hypothetical protein